MRGWGVRGWRRWDVEMWKRREKWKNRIGLLKVDRENVSSLYVTYIYPVFTCEH